VTAKSSSGYGLLEDWVYAESRLISSGDTALLTAHAKAQLSRALNAKKLIAVVGSGVSAGYGMPSWKKLLEATAAGVIDHLGSLLDDGDRAQLEAWIAPAHVKPAPGGAAPKPAPSSEFLERITWPGLAEALCTFRELKLPGKVDDLAADKLAVAFEATENLFALCRCWARSIETNAFLPREIERQAHVELREQLKWRLKDDRGRIELLFAGLFKDEEWNALVSRDGGQLVAEVEGEHDLVALCRCLNHLSYYMNGQNGIQSRGSDLFAAAFSLAFYDIDNELAAVDPVGAEPARNEPWGKQLAQRIPLGGLEPLSGILAKRLNEGKDREKDTPDKRFLVDAAFALLAPLEAAQLVASLAKGVIRRYGISGFASDGKCEQVPVRLTFSEQVARDVEAAGRVARANIPKMRDPIAIMVEDLRIKRFLTTNYDSQFDRYFGAKGYDEVSASASNGTHPEESIIPTGSRSVIQDLIGNHAEFTAYEVGAAPFLFDFGADTRDSGHRIVHIHGRAAKRESWLVLSERDYRERYARDDEPSARGDDAMRLVFTANPLLFVGLGMDEPDILRPLRAFTQDVGRLIDRPAIALLPQEGTDKLDDTWQRDRVFKDRLADVEKLDRYGVYVLRYGESDAPDIPGLARFMAAADKDKKDGTDEILGAGAQFPTRSVRWIHELLVALDSIGAQSDPRLAKMQAGALTIVREGLHNAIRTHFACEALKDCAVNWDEWLRSWSATPMRREPFGHQLMGVTLRKRDASDELSDRMVTSEAGWDGAVEEKSYFSASRHRILLRDSPDLETDSWVKYAQERILALGPDGAPSNAFADIAEEIPNDIASADENADAAGATEQLAPASASSPGALEDLIGLKPAELVVQRGPSTDRFFAGAPSPAFPLLQASLQSKHTFLVGEKKSAKEIERLALTPKSLGNRILFLLGHRGSGRGQMFNAMQSPRRFAQLCAWMGLIDHSPDGDSWLGATRDIHRGFFNLGLSHEVISVFDRLAYLLCKVLVSETRRLEPENVATVEKRIHAARANRIRRLRFVLEELQELEQRAAKKGKHVRRTLIVVDHLSVLFTQNGRPKNAQARRIYEALIDPQYAQVPVDYVFLASEDHTPYNLRCAELRRNRPDLIQQMRVSTGEDEREPVFPSYLDPVWLKPPHLPGDKEERTRRRLVTAQVWNSKTRLEPRIDARVFVHLLDPVRPATLAARFFPRLAATMLAIDNHGKGSDALLFFGTKHEFEERKKGKQPFDPNYVIELGDNIKRLQGEMVACFEHIFGGLGPANWADAGEAHDLALSLMDDGLDIATLRFPAAMTFAVSDDRQASSRPLGDETLEQVKEIDLAFFETIQSDSGAHLQVPQLFRTIIRAVGHNRYALTVVLAALDDMIARRIPGLPIGYVNSQPLREFVEKIRLATNGREPGSRADIVVDLVQDLYKTDTLGGLGQQLPAWPFPAPDYEAPIRSPGDVEFSETHQKSVWNALAQISNVLLQSLQEEILIALAKIGQPVSASAICAIGSIAELIQRILADRGINDDFIASKLGGKKHVAEIMILIWTCDLLVHRCLIFRVAPKGDEMEMHGRINHRFATHKVLRRTIFARFNMPLIDFSDVDQLTVSLYATQPNDLPRPSAETHRRNRLLVDQLAGYQHKPGEIGHSYKDAFASLPEHDTEMAKMRVERTRLRAAYGILRSIYSVGVVSRFSTHEGGGQPVPEHGYFESHRLRVRWLLRKAVALDGTWSGPDSEENAAHEADKRLIGERTFHAEEIVWLFNECGVLSLAQGRLTDAAALLGHARLTARDFLEGSEWGALHARIGLNLAVTSIERGRLGDAEATLHQILNDRRETDPLHLIAKGYLGEIDACRGMISNAYETFEQSANGLAMIRRSRAAAIMKIYHANALRQFDAASSLDKASQLAAAACDLATQGGHEDIRQLGQLAMSWIDIVKTEGRATAEEKTRIDRRLDAIGDYAKVMSMPRLQCQVALARSAFMISEGEFRMAAELAQIALQWATRHDMEFKKVAALGLLGTAMLRQANRSPRISRRAFNEAELLLRRARDLAYNMGFTAQVSKIEQVLTDYT
jgi:hypothetical protein